jgi:hypothetical protein
MLKGISQCISTVSVLYFGPFNPFHCTPLPLTSYPPFYNHFQYISLYPPTPQMLWLTILLMLHHSLFLSFLPQVLYYSSTITIYTFLYICLYTIMLVFVYMFIFWICLPHMRENMWPLSFWTWITSLRMMSSSCIHLPSNHILSFFLWLSTHTHTYTHTHTHTKSYFLHPFISCRASGWFPWLACPPHFYSI